MAKTDLPLKPIRWVGTARDDLLAFPSEARRSIGYALYFAQIGDRHPSTRPMRGFGGAKVLEVIEDCRGDTYRAVYTVQFTETIYVLHAFKKKAKRGIKTPKHELDLIKQRLRRAEEDHQIQHAARGDGQDAQEQQ